MPPQLPVIMSDSVKASLLFRRFFLAWMTCVRVSLSSGSTLEDLQQSAACILASVPGGLTALRGALVSHFLECDHHMIQLLQFSLSVYDLNCTPSHPLGDLLVQSDCFSPVLLLQQFLENIQYDVMVWVDMMMFSNDTSVLMYTLALCKKLVAHPEWLTNVPSERIVTFLRELTKRVGKLHAQGLCPFNVEPLLRLLRRVTA